MVSPRLLLPPRGGCRAADGAADGAADRAAGKHRPPLPLARLAEMSSKEALEACYVLRRQQQQECCKVADIHSLPLLGAYLLASLLLAILQQPYLLSYCPRRLYRDWLAVCVCAVLLYAELAHLLRVCAERRALPPSQQAR